MKGASPALFAGLSSLSLVFALACGGEGNTGRVTPPRELREQIPWVNGVPPLLDDNGAVIMSDVPVYPDIATGLEDPGSSEPNQSSGDPIARGCAAIEGVQFASAYFEDFEGGGGSLAAGLAWAGYDDASANSFRTPGFFNWYDGLTGGFAPGTFGLPADRIEAGPACDGEVNEFALHFKGGRFNRFGAGVDHALGLAPGMACPLDDDGSPSDLCAPEPEGDADVDSAGLPLTAFDEDGDPRPYAQPHVYWDLSRYDGIAFWARRGPEGQPTLLVKVQDKYTSDDLARENQKYCKRLRPCNLRCRNHEPCSPDDSGIFRCFDGEPEEYPGAGITDSGLEDLIYPRCGESACTSPGTYTDPDFVDATCEPYTFSSNHESGEYCVNPGEEPAAPEERCGDGPGTTVQLTTDWQFYKVPFSELRQLGFAQESPRLDRKSIAMISFIFTVGWVDTYLDNVTFYLERD